MATGTDVEIADLGRVGWLRIPEGPITGSVVALHGAEHPERRQPLFEHLASTLSPVGAAVLSYDRRPAMDSGDVPLEEQAADAIVAAAWLRERYEAPVGLFGFSQGAWAACVAAADSPTIASLVLVGCSGVSPARQMRFHTDGLLRRAGYDDAARDQLTSLRSAIEDLLRGEGDRETAGALLADAIREPWFPSAYLPPELPPEDVRWDDMDFDPAPVIERVDCPTLLIYGAEDDAVPVAESVQVWRDRGSRPLSVIELPGCGHVPTAGPQVGFDVADLSSDYTAALRAFFAAPHGGRSSRLD